MQLVNLIHIALYHINVLNDGTSLHIRAGSLPAWIGSLVELRQLDLQRNNIIGAIPTTIGKLKNLLYLNLKDNSNMSGPLPVRQLSKLTKLNRLSLVHCGFDLNGGGENSATTELQNALPRCRIWI